MKIQQRTNPQSGFAIGLILLAVVLIAAIVAAIAVGTRDSGNSANREKARLMASNLIQQGTALTNAMVRYKALGLNVGTNVLNGAPGFQLLVDEKLIKALPIPDPRFSSSAWNIMLIRGETLIVLPAVDIKTCFQVDNILWQARFSVVPAVSRTVDGLVRLEVDGVDHDEGCVIIFGTAATYFKRVF